jgi:hypothetical protein
MCRKLLFFPAGFGCYAGYLAALFYAQAVCSSLAALESSSALWWRIALGFTHGVLCFADGNIENLLGKLHRIARTFGHEPSIAQAAAPILAYEISN